MFLVDSPIFDRAVLHIGSRAFVVKTVDNSEGNKYVQKATLNDEPIDRAYLTIDEVLNGGTLVLTMGDQPSQWACRHRPPSFPARG